MVPNELYLKQWFQISLFLYYFTNNFFLILILIILFIHVSKTVVCRQFVFVVFVNTNTSLQKNKSDNMC